MYLSITAFFLFKLADGTDWHKVEARVVRAYQGAAAGFADPQTDPANKPTLAVLPTANVVAPVSENAANAAVPEEEVAGCQDECEGDDSEEPVIADAAPDAGQAKPDSPTVVNLPQPNETPAVVKNGQ
jgi:hypothetical protein